MQAIFGIFCVVFFVLLLLFSDLKHSREPDSVPAHRLSSNVPQPPPSRPSHDVIRALKPPLPINAETVSKQVLSKQARYQPIRADDLIAKAGTLTWVKKLLQVRLCKSLIPLLSDPSMSFSLFRRFAIFDLSNLWWRAGWWHGHLVCVMNSSAFIFLRKLQARQAFAMYLQRVQQRLVHETRWGQTRLLES